MLDFLMRLWALLSKLWSNVPPETQEEIKKQLWAWFEDILRKYYRSEKSETGE
jgi:hypothetical protein